MRAVVLGDAGRVRVAEAPAPAVRDRSDAVVQVHATAICGADLFPLHGMTPGFDRSTVLGHEFAGSVVDVGDGVTRIQVGQRVVCTSTISDGVCAHCRAGRAGQCERRALFGYSGVYPRLDGGQADLVRVPFAERCLYPLPDELAYESALFLADILPTGFAAVQRSGAELGDAVVVLGCGPVGLMALMCAARLGGPLIAVDSVGQRRDLAASLGAVAVPPAEAKAAVLDATDGQGADLVIEAAGSAEALHAALELARGQGSVAVVGAHFEHDHQLDAGRMFERELTLRFVIGDPLAHRERLMRMMLRGELAPEKVISHRLPLDQAPAAYRLFDQRQAVKIVLVP